MTKNITFITFKIEKIYHDQLKILIIKDLNEKSVSAFLRKFIIKTLNCANLTKDNSKNVNDQFKA